jgi:RimJ/RimL family protein N-acetyltransferase
LDIQPVTLEGVHVTLIPLDESHVEGLFEAGRHDEIWAYMPVRPATVDDMGQIVTGALEARTKGTELPFTIVEGATGQIVGSTRFLDIDRANKNLEIGWTWLTPSVWRSPVNTECKLLLLRHCFETLGTIRVFLKTDLRNDRSQRAMERLGCVREGVFRKHRILPDGYIRDSVYYSIIAEEWPAVKARLEGFLASRAGK